MKNYVQNLVFFAFIATMFFSSCTTSPIDDGAIASIKSENAFSQKISTSAAKVASYTISNWMGALDETKK